MTLSSSNPSLTPDQKFPVGELGQEGPLMGSREVFRKQQRRQIAEALLDLVTEGGFAVANVSALAERAGVARKTFYKYFPSIEAALLYAQQLVVAGMYTSSFENDRGSGLERFIAAVDRIRIFALEHPERMRFLGFFDFALSMYDYSDEEIKTYSSRMDDLSRPSLELFAIGQSDGSIDPDLVPQVTVATCANAVFGLAQRSVIIPNLRNQRSFIDESLQTEILMWKNRLSLQESASGLPFHDGVGS